MAARTFHIALALMLNLVGGAAQAVVDYAIDLRLQPDRQRLAADVTLRGLSCDNGRVRLHLNRSLNLRSAEVDGQPVQPVLDPAGAPRFWVSVARAIDLPCPQRTLRLRYDGDGPLSRDGRNQVSPDLIELSLYGVWYPIVALDQAITWRVDTTLRSDLISNAARHQRVTTAAGTRHRLEQRQPARDIALVASPHFARSLHRSGNATVEAYVSRLQPAAARERARALGAQAAATLAAYTTAWGKPTPGPLRAQLVFSPRSGPLSYARLPLVVTPDDALKVNDPAPARSQTLNLNHELAHFWSRAATGGADDWINEGLAETLALRRLRDNGAPGEAERVLDDYRMTAVRASGDSSIAQGLDDERVLLNRYQKPAMLFDKLERDLGEASLRPLLRALARPTPPGSPLTTAKLLAAAQTSLGAGVAAEVNRCWRDASWPAACGGMPAGGSPRRLTPLQQQQDFDEAVRLLIEVEVDPFLHVSRAAFDSRRDDLRALLTTPRTAAAFWRASEGAIGDISHKGAGVAPPAAALTPSLKAASVHPANTRPPHLREPRVPKYVGMDAPEAVEHRADQAR